ncbi:cytochrome c oxidase subunit 3 family protein [Conexibacter sp. SYSU D00693]|uniref:cytochrome c oxidase subunit 3 family protein n=1 Tax=Conexibacter sp. SYSU D00693 TaxID=2812560 RepID=UPI00196A4BBE|nr:cytochrome c oxidase subunit 3 family protein [Conexibacter sp. SYSU D00693]
MTATIPSEVIGDDREEAGPAAAAPSRWTRGHVPGEIGVWILVLGDMLVFAVLFGVFLVARSEDPAVFAASREELTQGFGAVNVVVLLTSSLLVALAVRSMRRGARAPAARMFVGAAACAAVFLTIKGIEYADKVAGGHDPGTNDFFMYFFILTGIHAAHVVLGMVALVVLWRIALRATAKPGDQRAVEVGATFWHMVDLLWVVLFPLLYLAS